MANIGFIGLGNMGAPMAVNLLKAGHSVKVYDLLPEHVEAAVSEGASSVASATDAVKDVEFVISMLPSGSIVENLYIHDSKLLNDIEVPQL